jgi:hypothetical protein
LQSFIADAFNGLGPNILVETLSAYQKPRVAHNNEGWSQDEQTGLFNKLVAISSLAGIQYYSESRKAMRVFYEASHAIDGPSSKNPRPDPEFEGLPASFSMFALQTDLTFGENAYRYDYSTGPGIIIFMQENMTPMSYGVIQAVGKNKFRSVVAVIDAGDSLLIYAAAMAKTVSVPGMGNRIGSSFSNRAQAVLEWFSLRADEVFR